MCEETYVKKGLVKLFVCRRCGFVELDQTNIDECFCGFTETFDLLEFKQSKGEIRK